MINQIKQKKLSSEPRLRFVGDGDELLP